MNRKSLSPERRLERRIDAVALGGALVLWGLAAYRRRFECMTDGLVYLEIARAYLRGDWAMAINAYWSPLYSWIFAALYALVRPSPYWEVTLLKTTNLFILVGAFFSYRFLLCELLRLQAKCGGALRGLVLPAPLLRALAYALFVWVSFCLLDTDTPDLLMSCFVYLAEGLLVRIALHRATWRGYAVLGGVCGLGYLAKAAFLPLSVVFLFCALLLRRPVRAHGLKVALSVGTLALVAAPFLACISLHAGHLSFGESGRVNYNIFVADNAYKLHVFQRLLGRSDPRPPRPLATGERLVERPSVYRFPLDAEVSYPLHHDPTRWTQWPTPYPSLAALLVSCLLNFARFLLTVVVAAPIALPAAIFLLKTQWSRKSVGEWLGVALLLLPPLAGIGMYLPVLVHFRYVAHFLIVLLSLALAVTELPKTAGNAKLLERLAVASLTITVLSAVVWLGVSRSVSTNVSWKVAQALEQEGGVRAGDSVCRVGKSSGAWAHLGRFRVRGEISDRDEFQKTGKQRQQEIYALLRAQGFVALVDEMGHGQPIGPEWRVVAGTDFAFLPLAESR